MTDEQKLLELQLADGTAFKLRGWKAVDRWNGKIQDAWAWLRVPELGDPYNIVAPVVTMLDALQNSIRNAQLENKNPADLRETIQSLWRKNAGPVHQDSALGRKILDIYEDSGPEAGLYALGLAKKIVSFDQAQTVGHGRGAILFAFPGLVSGEVVANRIANERRQAKAELQAALEAVETAETNRQKAFEHFLGESAERGIAGAKLRTERMVLQMRKWRDASQAAIDRLDDVTKTYNTFMTLKAPVDYWKQKSGGHKSNEKTMLKFVVGFFAVSLVVVSVLFALVGHYLVGLDKDTVHPSIFFVSSAGLGSIVALVLWGGRLITKIYLSEQHLRQDAYERETMTQTFMALVAEKVASEDDRQIVLNALFRPTSDGIVKEDGGLDPSIASALAKFLAKP